MSEVFKSGLTSTLILRYGMRKRTLPIDLLSRHEEKCNNKILKLSRAYKASPEEQEEMLQEARLSLYKSATDEKRKRGIITGFLLQNVERAVQKAFESNRTEAQSKIRKESGGSQRILNSRIEVTGGTVDECTLINNSASDDLDEGVFVKQVIDLTTADEKDRHILNGLLNGKQQNEIAKELGITPAAVKKRLNNIAQRMRQKNIDLN